MADHGETPSETPVIDAEVAGTGTATRRMTPQQRTMALIGAAAAAFGVIMLVTTGGDDGSTLLAATSTSAPDTTSSTVPDTEASDTTVERTVSTTVTQPSATTPVPATPTTAPLGPGSLLFQMTGGIVRYSDDGRTMLFSGVQAGGASPGAVITLRDAATATLLSSFGSIGDLLKDWSHDGKRVLYSHSPSGEYVLRDLPSGTEIGLGNLNETPASFSPDGTKVLTAQGVLDAADGHTIFSFGYPATLALATPDGLDVLTIAVGHAPTLWDITTGAVVRTFNGFGGWNAEISPDGTLAAVVDSAYGTQVFEMSTGAVRASHPGSMAAGPVIAFSPDSQTLVACDPSGTFTLYSTADGSVRTTFGGETGGFERRRARFTSDGTKLALQYSGATSVVDVATGRELVRIPGLSEPVFSPDGTTLAGDVHDGTVQFYRV